MSRYAYVAVGLLALVLLASSHWKAYVAGSNSVRAEWQAEKLQAEAQAEDNRLLAQAAINKVEKDRVARASESRVAVQTQIVEVEKYVPNTLTLLPGDFRVFHDAAATGQAPPDPGGADVAPVAPKDVAHTIAENYADSRYDQSRLEALQEIVRASGCFNTSGR